MKKILVTAVALLAAAGSAVGWAVVHDGTTEQTRQPVQAIREQQKSPEVVSYKGEDGKNALELLKQSYDVETKTYEGIGELATAINGVRADSKHFWSFYVDGRQSSVGAGAYMTKSTEVISWKFEEIK